MKNILMLKFQRVLAFRYARSMVGMFVASMTVLIVCALPARAIEIQEVVSPKGIRAWLVEDDSVPLISMRFSFKGGTSQDPSGKEGLANLMTGLFDEGAGAGGDFIRTSPESFLDRAPFLTAKSARCCLSAPSPRLERPWSACDEVVRACADSRDC